MLVDSHCHLDLIDPELGEPGEIMARARGEGVGRALCVSINLEDFPRMLAIVEALEGVYASVGVHPNERTGQDPDIETLVELAQRSPRIVAIGETGLDYYRSDGDTGWQRT